MSAINIPTLYMRSVPMSGLEENGELLLAVRIFVCLSCMQHGRNRQPTCVVAVSLVLSLAFRGIRQRFRVDNSKMTRTQGEGGKGEGVNSDCRQTVHQAA